MMSSATVKNKAGCTFDPSLEFEINNALKAISEVRSSFYEKKLLSPIISLCPYADSDEIRGTHQFNVEITVLLDGTLFGANEIEKLSQKSFEYWFDFVEDIGDGYSTWHYISKTHIIADYSDAVYMLENFISEKPLCKLLKIELM